MYKPCRALCPVRSCPEGRAGRKKILSRAQDRTGQGRIEQGKGQGRTGEKSAL